MDSYDLKDEEQAKEYLENIGVEYRFQCYHEKNPEGCHRLGDFLETFEKSLEKARIVYKKNCDDYQYGHSCFKYANYCFVGRGGEKEPKEAYKYYEKGCDQDFASACLNGGLMQLSDKFFPNPNTLKARKLLEKACDSNNAKSCQHMCGLYISGKAGKRDMKKAFEFASKGCDLGDRYACANVSIMYSKGDGVEKNQEQAERFKEIAKNIQKQEQTIERNIRGGE